MGLWLLCGFCDQVKSVCCCAEGVARGPGDVFADDYECAGSDDEDEEGAASEDSGSEGGEPNPTAAGEAIPNGQDSDLDSSHTDESPIARYVHTSCPLSCSM